MNYGFIINHNGKKVVLLCDEDFKILLQNEVALNELIFKKFVLFWANDYKDFDEYISTEWEGLLIGNDGMGYDIIEQGWF